MKRPELDSLLDWHHANKCPGLHNRRIVLPDLTEALSKMEDVVLKELLGRSYQDRPIFRVELGNGPLRVLMWTQMHGNESTGTKAFLDLLQFFASPGEFSELSRFILDRCTITCLPILNPDGAESYTRVNAQGIDLNRDVIDRKAPESVLLQEVLNETDPAYCFNLHDQRNIFSVGQDPKTATISFLAPSEDPDRNLTEGRKSTMRLIVSMKKFLQNGLSGRIGRYTDEFYPTATGDNFQKMGYSTVLIESGHYPKDLEREQSRKFTFAALVEGLRYIALDRDSENYEEYFDIPNNEKKYFDVIVNNVIVNDKKKDLGVLLKDNWNGSELIFSPVLDTCGDLHGYGADKVLDGQGRVFQDKKNAEKWVQNAFI